MMQIVKKMQVLNDEEVKIRSHIQKINNIIQENSAREQSMSNYLK